MLVVHEGASTSDESSLTDDSVFGRIVTGVQADVDAVISGHTHLGYDYELPVAGKALPLPVLQTGSYGTNLGHLSLTVDPATKALTSISSELVPLLTADGKPAFPADPAVQRIVDAAVAKAEVIGSRTAARSRAPSRAPARRTARRTAAASPRSATSSPTRSCGRRRRTSAPRSPS